MSQRREKKIRSDPTAQQPDHIDPETLPIVRQLREELARVTAERDAAMSFIPKIRDTCKYKDTPCDWCMYDPDGLDNWELDGLPKQTKQNTGDQDAEI